MVKSKKSTKSLHPTPHCPSKYPPRWPPRRLPLADLNSPLIQSGSLTEGAAFVGAGLMLASLLLAWPDTGCLPLLSACLPQPPQCRCRRLPSGVQRCPPSIWKDLHCSCSCSYSSSGIVGMTVVPLPAETEMLPSVLTINNVFESSNWKIYYLKGNCFI